MIDLHAHILPGLDDGPDDWNEALHMCRLALADGTTTVVATGHMFRGMFDVTRRHFLDCVASLRQRLEAERIQLSVEPGAEVHIEMDLCDRLRQGLLLTLADRGKYLVVELPRHVLPQGLSEFLFSVQLTGVTPIIAHPEKNLELQENPAQAVEFVSAGNLLQVTADSITGDAGHRAEECVHELLRRRLAHIVASDAHSSKQRPPGLSRARAVAEELLPLEEVEEMFERRPEKILAGDYVDLPEVTDGRPGKRKRWFSWKK